MSSFFSILHTDYCTLKRAYSYPPAGETRKDVILSGARCAGVLIAAFGGWRAINVSTSNGTAHALITSIFMFAAGYDSYIMVQKFSDLRKNDRDIFRLNTRLYSGDKATQEIGSQNVARELAQGTYLHKFLVLIHHLWTKAVIDFISPEQRPEGVPLVGAVELMSPARSSRSSGEGGARTPEHKKF